MKNQRLKYLAAGAMAFGLLASNGNLHAQTVESVMQKSQDNTAEMRKAQQRINAIAEQTDKLVQEYKVVVKQIEGLKVYNAQQELQIEDQQKQLATLEESIAGAATMERDIAPLMEKMIAALGDLVEHDIPFSLEERRARVEKLGDNLGRSNLSTAEKFRQVLEAYKIELDYGNNIESYTQAISVGGAEQDVNVLRIGRVALTYQTKDRNQSAAWNNETKSWEALDSGTWNGPISDGIKIANKQAPINIMTIPVSAPQEASR